jgi:hypothetical protein
LIRRNSVHREEWYKLFLNQFYKFQKHISNE